MDKLREQMVLLDKDKVKFDEIAEIKQKELSENPTMAKDYDKNKKIAIAKNANSYELMMDPKTTEEFKVAVEMAQENMVTRDNYADGLFQTVKQML